MKTSRTYGCPQQSLNLLLPIRDQKDSFKNVFDKRTLTFREASPRPESDQAYLMSREQISQLYRQVGNLQREMKEHRSYPNKKTPQYRQGRTEKQQKYQEYKSRLPPQSRSHQSIDELLLRIHQLQITVQQKNSTSHLDQGYAYLLQEKQALQVELQQQAEESRLQISTLTDEKYDLKTKLELQRRANDQLKLQNEKCRIEIAALNKSIDRLSRCNQSRQTQCKQSEREISQQSKELLQLRMELQVANYDLQRARQEIGRLQQALQTERLSYQKSRLSFATGYQSDQGGIRRQGKHREEGSDQSSQCRQRKPAQKKGPPLGYDRLPQNRRERKCHLEQTHLEDYRGRPAIDNFGPNRLKKQSSYDKSILKHEFQSEQESSLLEHGNDDQLSYYPKNRKLIKHMLIEPEFVQSRQHSQGQQLRQIPGQIQALQLKLQRLSSKYELTQLQKQQLSLQVKRLQQQNREKSEQLSIGLQQLYNKQCLLEAQAKQQANLKSRLQQLAQQCKGAKSSKQLSSLKNAELTSQILQLELGKQKYKAQNQQLIASQQRLMAQLNQLRERRRKDNQRLNSAQQQSAQLSGQLSKCKVHNQKLQKQVRAQRQRLGQCETQLKQSKSDLQRLSAKNKELRLQSIQHQVYQAELDKRVTEFESTLKQKNDICQKLVECLEAKKAEAEQLRRYQSMYLQQSKKSLQLKSEFVNIRLSLEQSAALNDKYLRQIRQKIKEAESLRQQLDQSNRQRQKLQLQLQFSTLKLDHCEEKLQQRTRQFEQLRVRLQLFRESKQKLTLSEVSSRGQSSYLNEDSSELAPLVKLTLDSRREQADLHLLKEQIVQANRYIERLRQQLRLAQLQKANLVEPLKQNNAILQEQVVLLQRQLLQQINKKGRPAMGQAGIDNKSELIEYLQNKAATYKIKIGQLQLLLQDKQLKLKAALALNESMHSAEKVAEMYRLKKQEVAAFNSEIIEAQRMSSELARKLVEQQAGSTQLKQLIAQKLRDKLSECQVECGNMGLEEMIEALSSQCVRMVPKNKAFSVDSEMIKDLEAALEGRPETKDLQPNASCQIKFKP